MLVVLAVLIPGGDEEPLAKPHHKAAVSEKPDDKTAAPAEPTKAAKKPERKPAAPQGPVKLTANTTTFTPDVPHDGSKFTSVRVTVTNSGDKNISVNPLYFAITDAKGTKHDTADGLGQDKNHIDTVDLAPGENISGSITAKGEFTPKYVTYGEPFGDSIRAAVS